ncbi:uncharacterized protein DEA37_0007897, partial [Paragonimus westermani]
TLANPDARFSHAHVDIVGPLSHLKGHRCNLICVDRFTRWPMAIPLRKMNTEGIARAFIHGWVSNHGVERP